MSDSNIPLVGSLLADIASGGPKSNVMFALRAIREKRDKWKVQWVVQSCFYEKVTV